MATDKTKKKELKQLFEREYVVPLRKEWLKVPKYKRATKAVKALKEFMVRNMKVYDRDLRRIKIDITLNNELRFRGMRKPAHKIKVLAKKYDDETVKVFLVDIPEHVKFARLREEKAKSTGKKTEEKVTEKAVAPQDSKVEETKQKEEASKEESLNLSKEQAIEQKHTSKPQGAVEKSFQTKKAQKGR